MANKVYQIMRIKKEGIYNVAKKLDLYFTTQNVANKYIQQYCLCNDQIYYKCIPAESEKAYSSLIEYIKENPACVVDKMCKTLDELAVNMEYIPWTLKDAKKHSLRPKEIRFSTILRSKMTKKNGEVVITFPNKFAFNLSLKEFEKFKENFNNQELKYKALKEKIEIEKRKFNIKEEENLEM